MLARLKIASRLAIAVAVLALVLAVLAAYDLSSRWNTRAEMVTLGHLAQGVGGISRFVHELQRERGASAVFIASKGAQMRSELGAQRERTDGRRAGAGAFMKELSGTVRSQEFRDAIAEEQAAETALDGKRSEVDGLRIATRDSTSYYTTMIERLLLVTGEIAKVSIRGDITTAISAYVNLMLAKERAGLERATGAAGISTGRFEVLEYKRLLGLAAAQEAYFANFESAATPDERAFFKQTTEGPVADNVLKMREVVLLGGARGRDGGARR